MRINIFGGGIGGLTTAHQLALSPNNNYEIHIYEKKNEIGGLARSGRDYDGCATEYCWRVYFNFYNNIFKIMSQIPLLNDRNKNVLDNLTVYRHYNVVDKPLSLRDRLVAIYNIFYGFTSCDQRLNKLDEIAWWDALGITSDSNLFREIGGWLGMDRYNGSYKSVIKVGMEMQILEGYLNNNYKDWITNKPTSEAWFDHWKQHLINNNVHFHMNTELVDVVISNNKIQSTTVRNNNKLAIVPGDGANIFSLPIEVLDKIITQTPELQHGRLLNVKQLKDTCLHIQLSFQLYFDRPISLGKNNAFLVVDAPWDIIVLSYDVVYQDTQLCKNIPRANGCWSVAATTAYIPGILYNKPMTECTYDEIINELWAQLTNSKQLKQFIEKNNDFGLTKDIVVKWSPLWPSYSDKNGRLTTTEPKFTNNKGSWKLRPSFKTDISNLFIATGYIQETIDIFSMEAACIAGKRVANAINNHTPKPQMIPRPSLFSPFRYIDQIAYNYQLPNLSILLIVLLLVFIIIISYKSNK